MARTDNDQGVEIAPYSVFFNEDDSLVLRIRCADGTIRPFSVQQPTALAWLEVSSGRNTEHRWVSDEVSQAMIDQGVTARQYQHALNAAAVWVISGCDHQQAMQFWTGRKDLDLPQDPLGQDWGRGTYHPKWGWEHFDYPEEVRVALAAAREAGPPVQWADIWKQWNNIFADFLSVYRIHINHRWLQKNTADYFRVLIVGLLHADTRLNRAIAAERGKRKAPQAISD